jgi:hypothetical protein
MIIHVDDVADDFTFSRQNPLGGSERRFPGPLHSRQRLATLRDRHHAAFLGVWFNRARHFALNSVTLTIWCFMTHCTIRKLII